MPSLSVSKTASIPKPTLMLSSSASTTASTPKQDALKTQISVLEAELNAVVKKRDAGLGDEGIWKIIKKLIK